MATSFALHGQQPPDVATSWSAPDVASLWAVRSQQRLLGFGCADPTNVVLLNIPLYCQCATDNRAGTSLWTGSGHPLQRRARCVHSPHLEARGRL